MPSEPDPGSIESAVPAVSVLLPCWNAAGSIAAALASVLAEREVDLEVIVVDDGSTDATADVVLAIALKDPRVRLIRQPDNRGVSAARNLGLEHVRGEWLTLLDADDRFRPGAIGILHRAATSTGALAVVGQQVWVSGRRRWIGPLYDIPDIRAPGRKSLASAPGLLYFVSPHAKLFQRSTFEGLRFEGRVLGDQPWVIRALLRAGDRIEVISDTVYEWIREAPGGPSITATTRSSVRRGIEAAGIAASAFAQVRDEAEARVPDPAGRRAVLDAYAGRLLRSDLAAHVATALSRRDPGAGELFAAIEAFLRTIPAASLAATDALARDLIEPPLRRWPRVAPTARPAFWSLAAAALAADPKLATRGSNPVARRGLALALQRRSPASRRLGIAMLMATQPQALVQRVARRLVSG